MNVVKTSPFSARTKSLRERFGSKRSYSENFKDPPAPSSANRKDSVGRNVRPSMPNIGLPLPAPDTASAAAHSATMMQHLQEQQQQRKHQATILSEHFNPFAALPEETYCSALDINSQQGDDPRFPWQRDAAVQCDMSLNGEGYRYARKDSFYMISRDATIGGHREEGAGAAPAAAAMSPPQLSTTASAASLSSATADISMTEKFREVFWPNLSICAEEEDETTATSRERPERGKEKKASMLLQRALSERSRCRRRYTPDETPPSSPKILFGEGNYNSAPASRTETPPSDSSPQTPPSRRNSRKIRKFVRKQTSSATDSFDEAGTPPTPRQQKKHAVPDAVGSGRLAYFNFDSMQMLLDLSMTAKPEKPSFLLTPSDLGVGKDKGGAYMTLPSPNVQNADEQVGPTNVFKRISSVDGEDSEREEEEEEEAEHAPPASALHRRRALIPPKMLTDGYESSNEENEQLFPNGSSPASSDGSSGSRHQRRSSIVVIPPMQICPGDLLVYSKVLTQRNTLLDFDGSTQSLSVSSEETTRKAKNSWSLLRLFDRSNRSKSESLCGLEEVLSSLQPSEFIDEHLSKYKGMSWAEFASLWEGRTKKNKNIIQKTKWLNFSKSSSSTTAVEPPPSPATASSPVSPSSPSSAFRTSESATNCSSRANESPFTFTIGSRQVIETTPEDERRQKSCSALDHIEHQIHNIGARTRCRNELKRREALWDLFQSECMFLYDHLMVLKNVFMEPLKKIQVEGFAMFAEPEVLFGNLDELCCVTYSFCKEFLSLILQKMSGDEVDTTEVLVKLFQKSAKANALTQAYHRYTLNYINALNYLETLRRQVEFNEFEKWCSRDMRCKKLQLTDLLVSPVQHVMRVPLILKEIEIRTEDDREKYFVSNIIESEEMSLRELDDKMSWLKNFERLLEIQRSIVWPSVCELDPKAFIPDFLKQSLAKQPCERLIVSPRRQIVLEGSLHLLDCGKPSETFVLLFDDMLLITRRKKGLHKKKSSISESWASASNKSSCSSHESGYKYVVYKQPLSLDRFFIQDVSQQEGTANNLKNAFVLVCLNRFQQITTVHTFQAPNEAVKNLWLSKLRDTMDHWKRTLQNTVFRSQRTASTCSSSMATSHPAAATTVLK